MKKSFLALLAVVAMASCTKSDLDERNVTGQDEIKLKSEALNINATSRAPYEGIIGPGNELEALVVKSLVINDYSPANGANVTGIMKFVDNNDPAGNGTEVGFMTTPQYYPVDATQSVYLSGLYPTTGWGTFTTVSRFQFDGSQDVMASGQVETKKSDVTTNLSTIGYKTLHFKHLLTKLVIKAIADPTYVTGETAAPGAAALAAQDAWGKITKIELYKVQNTQSPNIQNRVTVTLATGAVDNFSTSGLSADVVKIFEMTANGVYGTSEFESKTVTIPQDARTDITQNTPKATDIAYTMLAPIVPNNTNDFTFKVYTEKYTAGYEVPIGITLPVGPYTNTAGLSYDITLTFKATEIKALATVTDWVPGGEAGGTIE